METSAHTRPGAALDDTHSGRNRLWLIAKIVLLVIFAFAATPGLSSRVQQIGWQMAGQLLFAAVWLLALAGLILVSISPYRGLRWFWSLVWTPSAATHYVYWQATNKHLGFLDFESLIGLVAFADNLVSFYPDQLLAGLGLMVLGLVAINMPGQVHIDPRKPAILPGLRRATLLVPLLPMLAEVGILVARGGEGTDGMPSHTGGPAFSVLLVAEKLISGPPPERKAVGIQASPDGPRRHLIVVMDESVRGDLIDLNQPGTARTGLLPHVENLANFGVASSMANCSDTGNYSFRYAATAERYLEDVVRHPSLFEYARKAGYATAYLDGQRYEGRMQNFMDEREKSQIDVFYQLPAETGLADHDRLLAEKIVDLVEDSSQPQFIFVNKMGSHFPYEGKYPAERRLFKPTMHQNYFGHRADLPVRKLTMDESAESRLRFRNSYLNSVSWNAESFFAVLTARLNFNDSIILYTADHGQDLHEDGRKGWGTHCSHGDSVPGEGRVPLLLIGGGHEFLARAKRAAAMNHDQANQFSAARSLLLLLGYDRNDLNRELGVQPDLFEDLSGYQPGFLSTYFVRFKAEPVWNSIK